MWPMEMVNEIWMSLIDRVFESVSFPTLLSRDIRNIWATEGLIM